MNTVTQESTDENKELDSFPRRRLIASQDRFFTYLGGVGWEIDEAIVESPIEYEMGVPQILGLPIEYKNDSIILNPKYMKVGTPCPFLFEGHWILAVKQDDESIEFYYLPDKGES